MLVYRFEFLGPDGRGLQGVTAPKEACHQGHLPWVGGARGRPRLVRTGGGGRGGAPLTLLWATTFPTLLSLGSRRASVPALPPQEGAAPLTSVLQQVSPGSLGGGWGGWVLRGPGRSKPHTDLMA